MVWAFLCIWYENSWFWVHEVKRLGFLFYMALCIPIHLRQRTSRIYQDHLHLCWVLTSFVPPVHNQGVSLAPCQGLALWKIFLPTTGSFFVFLLTLLRQQHFSADVFLLLSASNCPSPGKIQLNLLITLYRGWNQMSRVSMKWHGVPLIADSNHDILRLRFSHLCCLQ